MGSCKAAPSRHLNPTQPTGPAIIRDVTRCHLFSGLKLAPRIPLHSDMLHWVKVTGFHLLAGRPRPARGALGHATTGLQSPVGNVRFPSNTDRGADIAGRLEGVTSRHD
jgi:hypothetical protein